MFSAASSPLVKGGHVKSRHSFHMCFLRPQLIAAHMTYGSRIDGIWKKGERGKDGERHLSAYAALVRCGLAPSSHGSTRATRCTHSPAFEKGRGAQSPKLAFCVCLQLKRAKWHRPHERFGSLSYCWSSHIRSEWLGVTISTNSQTDTLLLWCKRLQLPASGVQTHRKISARLF